MKDHARAGVVLFALVAALVALSSPGIASADDDPVPSIDPDWSAQFVPPAMPRLRAALRCTPVDAVFYAQTDWLRLAQKLRSNPSTCANYYVSVPPLAADKTALRVNQAGPIRALGSQFHAMAEVNVSGWASWVAADSSRTWFGAGIEARRRMAAAGFDVSAGDIWGVNEFSSAVRTGTGNARQNMRELVRGLYTGDGNTRVPGLIWVTGIGQPTTFLGTYKTNLKNWLGDAPFWADMSQYVRFYSQEVYGSITNWAVPGTLPQDRLTPLVDYLEQIGILTGRAPVEDAAQAAYVAQADAPTGNAAWPSAPYGWPGVPNTPPFDAAEAYVAAQVYAFRHYQAPRPSMAFGFAWNPANTTPAIPNFTTQTAAILDRLAASIHASDLPTDDPGIGACGADLSWCSYDIAGSSFNLGWSIFHTWTQPVATPASVTTNQDTPLPIKLAGVDPDQGETLSYEIVTQPLHGTVTNDGANATYTPAQGYFGADSFAFRVSDGVMFSVPATVTVDVNGVPTVTLDPAGPVDEGAAPIAVTAHASDPDGDPVTLTWSTPDGTPSFAADDGPATVTMTVTADDGRGGVSKASTDIEVRNVPPTADAGPDVAGVWGTPVSLAGSASDPSAADRATLTASWDFGDGSTGDGFKVDHVYAEPGTYTATLTARDKDGGTATDTTTVTVGARSATLADATPSVLDVASAVVGVQFGDATDAGSARLEGRAVTIGVGSSTCTATSDKQGLATCTLGKPPLGPGDVSATFGGDALYSTASTTAPVLLYGLPAGGAFVVGDGSANGVVTFWGPSWWLANTLTGGHAPASFKGFVQAGPNGWTASPGLDHAPATVPAWMGVVVATSVTKDGPVITAAGTKLVVVHVDSYDPSLAGRGTVVSDGS